MHILCEDNRTAPAIASLMSKYYKKLKLVNLGQRLHYKHALEYASKNLLMKTCVIMNSDCYIGQGFEKINQTILQNGTIYALTRHGTKDHILNCSATDMCGPTSTYIGSHDAFIINLVKPIPNKILMKFDFRQNIYGAENAAIYFLQHFGKFIVKNPCRILHIYHNHCIRFDTGESKYISGKHLYLHLKVPSGEAPMSGL